jgi:hypothetical protein
VESAIEGYKAELEAQMSTAATALIDAQIPPIQVSALAAGFATATEETKAQVISLLAGQ